MGAHISTDHKIRKDHKGKKRGVEERGKGQQNHVAQTLKDWKTVRKEKKTFGEATMKPKSMCVN